MTFRILNAHTIRKLAQVSSSSTKKQVELNLRIYAADLAVSSPTRFDCEFAIIIIPPTTSDKTSKYCSRLFDSAAGIISDGLLLTRRTEPDSQEVGGPPASGGLTGTGIVPSWAAEEPLVTAEDLLECFGGRRIDTRLIFEGEPITCALFPLEPRGEVSNDTLAAEPVVAVSRTGIFVAG